MSGLKVVCVQPMQTMENPGIAGRGASYCLKSPRSPLARFISGTAALERFFASLCFRPPIESAAERKGGIRRVETTETLPGFNGIGFLELFP